MQSAHDSPGFCRWYTWAAFHGSRSPCMTFHIGYWNRHLKNSSHEFNYQDWNEHGRKDAVKQVGPDTRRQSEALEPVELDPQIRLVPSADGMFVFSAAHLHSTVPNTSGRTRLSIVLLDDPVPG